jgi:hypothetical protein
MSKISRPPARVDVQCDRKKRDSVLLAEANPRDEQIGSGFLPS